MIWRPLMLFNTRAAARRSPESSPEAASARLYATGGSQPPFGHSHRHRPGCSVRRIAGHLEGDIPRRREKRRLPVQRPAAGRGTPGRERLQPQQQLHLEPDAAGDLPDPGGRQDRVRRPARAKSRPRRIRPRRELWGTAPWSSPMANPLVALYSAPPSAGTSMYVQFAEQGPTLSWQRYVPAAHRSRREHQLHRGRYAAQHDLSHAERPG